MAKINHGARLKRVAITAYLWLEMCTLGWNTKGHWLECTEGLPEGAEIVNSDFDGRTNQLYLIVHHESFPQVEYGNEIPLLSVMFTRHENWAGDNEY